MNLSRDRCHAVPWRQPPLDFEQSPIQLGLGRDPWRVAVASMLLCRTTRKHMKGVLRELFYRYPTPADLARAEHEVLEDLLRPCGLQRVRARRLQRFSNLYLGTGWDDLHELPGVGLYVADCVNIFCFGARTAECTDGTLLDYLEGLNDDETVQAEVHS